MLNMSFLVLFFEIFEGATSWEKPEEEISASETSSSVDAEEDVDTLKDLDGEEREEAKDYTGRTGGIEITKDKESTWEQVKGMCISKAKERACIAYMENCS